MSIFDGNGKRGSGNGDGASPKRRLLATVPENRTAFCGTLATRVQSRSRSRSRTSTPSTSTLPAVAS